MGVDVQERCILARFKGTLGLYLANQFSLELIWLLDILVIVFIYRCVFIVNPNVIVHHTPIIAVVSLITAILRGYAFVLKLVIATSFVETGRVSVFLQLNIRVALFLSLVVTQKFWRKLSQLCRSTESKSIVTLLVRSKSMNVFNDMARCVVLAVALVNAALVWQNTLLGRLLMQVQIAGIQILDEGALRCSIVRGQSVLTNAKVRASQRYRMLEFLCADLQIRDLVQVNVAVNLRWLRYRYILLTTHAMYTICVSRRR